MAKKEVFAEAKGEGFDVKILKEIVKLRKQDPEERDENETLLAVYMRAMDSAPSAIGKSGLIGFLAQDRWLSLAMSSARASRLEFDAEMSRVFIAEGRRESAPG